MCFFKESINFLVLAFSIIFLLTGVALVSIGAIHQITFSDLSKAIPDTYEHLHLIPLLTLIAGSLIIVFTALGCCGALYKNRWLLFTFAVLLVSVFFLQISIGIFTFLEVQDHDDLANSINITISDIFVKKEDTDFINQIQTQLHCCGTYGQDFWSKNMNMPVPQSCCDDSQCEKMYTDGCQNGVFEFLTEAARVVGISVLAFSAAEGAGAVLAAYMAKMVKGREGRGYRAAFYDEE